MFLISLCSRDVIQSNPMYPVPPHGKGILHSSVWDVTQPPVASQSTLDPSAGTNGNSVPSTAEDPETQTKQSSLPEGVEPNSVDIAIMIFVLSALHPLEWQRAIANVYKVRSSSSDRDVFCNIDL
jgi:tRNAThr (cytosine32-N3)-methyltransferase